MDSSDSDSWFDEFTEDSYIMEDLHHDDEAMLIANILDEEQDDEQHHSKRGGSQPGRAPNKDRRRELYAKLLFENYWGSDPAYDEADFRRRFRMPKGLFEEIFDKVINHDRYFVQKMDAINVRNIYI